MREGATERQRHNREHSSETVTSVDRRRPSLPDQQNEGHMTRATAQLPGLQIEIVHRQSAAGDAEQISISLQAVPSFEAFGRFLEATNPLAFGPRPRTWRGFRGWRPAAHSCCPGAAFHRKSTRGNASDPRPDAGCFLYGSQGAARWPPSNAQCEHLDEGDSDHEHRECHEIVLEPVLSLCVHDTPPYSRSLVGLAGGLVQIRGVETGELAAAAGTRFQRLRPRIVPQPRIPRYGGRGRTLTAPSRLRSRKIRGNIPRRFWS